MFLRWLILNNIMIMPIKAKRPNGIERPRINPNFDFSSGGTRSGASVCTMANPDIIWYPPIDGV